MRLSRCWLEPHSDGLPDGLLEVFCSASEDLSGHVGPRHCSSAYCHVLSCHSSRCVVADGWAHLEQQLSAHVDKHICLPVALEHLVLQCTFSCHTAVLPDLQQRQWHGKTWSNVLLNVEWITVCCTSQLTTACSLLCVAAQQQSLDMSCGVVQCANVSRLMQ